MRLVRNLFGHRKYKHMLLSGDYATMKKQKKEMKTNIEIGDYVISKPINGKIYEGTVTNISKKSVTVALESGKFIRLYYFIIDRIEGKKKMLKKTENIEELKKNIKVGDNIKAKIRGIIQKGIVVSVNPKRIRARMDDGKEFYLPYEMIL